MNRQHRRAKARKRGDTFEASLEFIEENGEPVLYLSREGVRIAKRYPGQKWISLEPGLTVRGAEPGSDQSKIELEYAAMNERVH